MRTLITLALFQTGILLVILFKMPGDDASPVADAAPATQERRIANDSFPPARARTEMPANASSSLDEARLRAIVRDEMQQLVAELRQPRDTEQETFQPAIDPQQRRHVIDRIEYYKSVGEVSPQEMNDLMSDIARLDNKSRQEALSRLTQALNGQGIDGRF